jgi:hypothetical protein
MKKIKVVTISNFHEDVPISRSNMASNYYQSRGYEVKVLYSIYSHSLKAFRMFTNVKHVPIKAIAYQSSLSIRRIISYLLFSYGVYKYLSKTNCDIIYVNIPPNLLSLSVLLFKPKHVKIIIDVVDLWPEAFPHGGNQIKKTLLQIAGILPKMLRKLLINQSHYCIAESKYFYKKLQLSKKVNSDIIYLKKFQEVGLNIDNVSEELSIAYLGNIGAIYDFDGLVRILNEVAKVRKVKLHIIGLGPLKEWLVETLELNSILFTYHGASFDENFKKKILQQCWFGFNGYTNHTEVALSYKSVDYLSYGVPLINSAKEDTEHFVAEYNVGFNYVPNYISEIISKLANISKKEMLELRKNAYNLFSDHFSGESYYSQMDNVMRKLNT